MLRAGSHEPSREEDVALETRLAQYEVLEVIGSGGMGTVHRAHDSRLGRDVALKRLPAGSVGDAVARARMLREARLAATLSHPNVCTIFDVGESDGEIYIAMELVRGQTLSEKIGAAGLPEAETLRLGRQIADALAHAHEQGIVHRDLKTANVVIGHDGRARVLDFGLASRSAAAPEAETVSMQVDLTATGAIVGTPGYLAPELLRGGAADARSDLWSLGVLLYEMASGGRPFAGASALELGAAILHQEPAPLPNRVSPGLRAVILRCLEKDPARRYASAGEVRTALDALMPGSSGAPARPSRNLVPFAIAAVLLVAAAITWVLIRAPGRPHEIRQRQIASGTGDDALVAGALSPDGRSLALVTSRGLEVRDLESGDARKIALPDGFTFRSSLTPIASVAWFPDGRELLTSGSMRDGSSCLWAIPVIGGGPRKLRGDGAGGSVSPDGKHLAFLRPGASGPEIWCSGPNGENPRRLVASDSTGTLTVVPSWSPRSSRLAYLRMRIGLVHARIVSCDLEGHERTMYQDTPQQSLHPYGTLAWLPDHRVIFGLPDPPPSQSDFNLWWLRVDPQSGRPSGAAQRITHWTRASLLLPMASADGRRLVVATLSYQSDCFVGRISRDSLLQEVRRVTLDDRMDVQPAWQSDERAIYFTSDRNGTQDIFRQALDARDAQAFVTGPGDQYSPRVSPDGAWLLYFDLQKQPAGSARAAGGSDALRLMRMPVEGGPAEVVCETKLGAGLRCARAPATTCALLEAEGTACALTAIDPRAGRGRVLARLDAQNPAWDLSPDGRSLAWTDERDSVLVIHVMSLSDGSRRGVKLDRPFGYSYLAWAASGDGWFLSGAVPASESGVTWELLRVTATGATRDLLPGQMWMYGFAPSPDGRSIVFTSNTGQGGGWLLEDF